MRFFNSQLLLPLAALDAAVAPDTVRGDFRRQAVEMLRYQAWKNAEVKIVEDKDEQLECLRIRGSMPDWRSILEELAQVIAQAGETGETWRIYERQAHIRDLLDEYTRGDDE